MKNKKNFATNSSGMALLMVITVIALLSYILIDFTFETKLNKLKINNMQDKTQARLNAESGLHLAMARLNMYQTARNLVATTKTLQKVIKEGQLAALYNQPPMILFPIPLTTKSGLVFKSAVRDFEKNSMLRGKISVTIAPVSGAINPNNLRFVKKSKINKSKKNRYSADEEEDSPAKRNKKKLTPQQYTEQKLLELLTKAIDNKREKNDEFDAKYSNLNPELLIKEIKFYVNLPKNFNDVERAEIEATYLAEDIIPKHAPLTSLDELYLLIGWDDEIVNLIKDQLTVDEPSIIAVNELTSDLLALIFPDITEDQIEEFFDYRDGNKELGIKPHPFDNAEDFKNTVTGELGIISSSKYAERVTDLEEAGLRLGVAGKLFLVTSQGERGRSIFTLKATVDLPLRQVQTIKKKRSKKSKSRKKKKQSGIKKKPQLQLLKPRIINIKIE